MGVSLIPVNKALPSRYISGIVWEMLLLDKGLGIVFGIFYFPSNGYYSARSIEQPFANPVTGRYFASCDEAAVLGNAIISYASILRSKLDEYKGLTPDELDELGVWMRNTVGFWIK